MEGEFMIYKGFIKRWISYKYILTENIITFSKNQEYIGKIHLKISNIIDKKNSTRFNICNGINTIKLKCKNIESKNKLIDMIQTTKNKILKKNLEKRANFKIKNKNINEYDWIKDDINLLINNNSTNKLTKILNKFWDDLAIFNNDLGNLFSKISLNEETKQYVNNLINSSKNIRDNINKSLKLIEKEKEKIKILVNYLSQIDNKELFVQNFNKNKENILNNMNTNNDDINDLNEFKSDINDNSRLFLSHNKTENDRKKFFNKVIEINEKILNLINNNPVFIKYPLNDEVSRDNLPVLLPEKESYSLLAILKNLLGKDLTRIALPVFMNEPLSFLQKIGELFIYFKDIENKILETDSEELQMIYMHSISYIQYSHTVNKLKKPFNPLLGEIFNMEIKEIGMKIIMEQVSHHPPISAFYGENDNFIIEGHTQVCTNLSLRGFDVTPRGPIYFTNKKTGEKYLSLRAKSYVHNYLFGKTYVWHSGDMVMVNLRTKKKIIINLEKHSMRESNRKYISKGEVKDDNNNLLYEIIGKWNSFLNVFDVRNKKTIKIIELKNLKEKGNYFMTDETLNFNLLNNEMLENLCPNDSRLRPDQRALEYQDIELATIQKNKLEVNQRVRKKERLNNGEKYLPKFFEKIGDDWVYKGNFYKHYENKDWGLLENIYDNL